MSCWSSDFLGFILWTTTLNVDLPICMKRWVSPVKYTLKILAVLLMCIWTGKDAKLSLVSFIRKKYESSFGPSVDRMGWLLLESSENASFCMALCCCKYQPTRIWQHNETVQLTDAELLSCTEHVENHHIFEVFVFFFSHCLTSSSFKIIQ